MSAHTAPLRVLDLFSGIGGFSLGLERAGMQTVAFCEIELYCRAILKRHWPHVPIYDDIRTLTGDTLARDGITVDVICGGFPCQDISVAGAGAGIDSERSGLWREYARLIGEIRPQFIIVENVAALLGRGLGRVLGDLAALGYDAEWHCIPASAVGAPHRRDRIWIVAHPGQVRRDPWRPEQSLQGARQPSEALVADADAIGRGAYELDEHRPQITGPLAGYIGGSCASVGRQWVFEPELGRVAYGVPNRVDRVAALGNAVVPQIPEMIGRAIIATQKEGRAEARPEITALASTCQD